eukprot:COSAG01_NODE_1451_length_10269_cov_16.336578_9_plen_171_part_00
MHNVLAKIYTYSYGPAGRRTRSHALTCILASRASQTLIVNHPIRVQPCVCPSSAKPGKSLAQLYTCDLVPRYQIHSRASGTSHCQPVPRHTAALVARSPSPRESAIPAVTATGPCLLRPSLRSRRCSRAAPWSPPAYGARVPTPLSPRSEARWLMTMRRCSRSRFSRSKS